MSKPKRKREAAELYQRITRSTAQTVLDEDEAGERDEPQNHAGTPITNDMLAASRELARLIPLSPHPKRDLPKMKKFRFQLLHTWMLEHLEPCRVADVGGGKGLLTYLLQQSGWPATVIDPVHQSLPVKYKDLQIDKQVHIDPAGRVPRIDRTFAAEIARDFDLLVAMHAHGCNIQLIDAAAEYERNVILLPCCIIQEPLQPPAGVHWIQWLVDYATGKGFALEPFRLNFRGQNIGFYAQRRSHGSPRI
ncbi:MAG: hypothetical protein EXR62_09900 [Chloroflexi bacterium]|nr:hypothetical protein [Chloroflexota bacterium]